MEEKQGGSEGRHLGLYGSVWPRLGDEVFVRFQVRPSQETAPTNPRRDGPPLNTLTEPYVKCTTLANVLSGHLEHWFEARTRNPINLLKPEKLNHQTLIWRRWLGLGRCRPAVACDRLMEVYRFDLIGKSDFLRNISGDLKHNNLRKYFDQYNSLWNIINSYSSVF